MSYKQDVALAGTYLFLDGPSYEKILLETAAAVEAANPERMRSFIGDGNSHIYTGGKLSKTVAGISLFDWLTAMLADSPGWVSAQD